MEEAQTSNGYINARGEAIEAIERTISELGGIFGQLASMVSEQSEMIQRIDANTEDVVDNVQGAQRYDQRISSHQRVNRFLPLLLRTNVFHRRAQGTHEVLESSELESMADRQDGRSIIRFLPSLGAGDLDGPVLFTITPCIIIPFQK